MQAQDFYPVTNDYISPANNGSKLMMSGYNSTGKEPFLTDKGGFRNPRTRNESGPAKLSLSLTNAPEFKPPKSGMSKNDMQYLTPQLSNRPSTSGNQGGHGRRMAQAFRERVKS